MTKAMEAGAADGARSAPRVGLAALDTLWFQVAGTLCNLACTHCLVEASPTNRTHAMMTLAEVRRHLADALRFGVKEYYFTGGEPFLNDAIEPILAATLEQGPATVLTNGLRFDRARCARLRRMADAAEYSLDLRVSLDGYDAATNDPIRGEGTFDRIVRGIRNLSGAGFAPVITVTEACDGVGLDEGRRRFLDRLAELGVARPRLKVLPLFRIGAEAERSGAYAEWQRLERDDVTEDAKAMLQCNTSRIVTARGVWVCPILVNDPAARMGERLDDARGAFELSHQACWTCHVEGASCRT